VSPRPPSPRSSRGHWHVWPWLSESCRPSRRASSCPPHSARWPQRGRVRDAPTPHEASDSWAEAQLGRMRWDGDGGKVAVAYVATWEGFWEMVQAAVEDVDKAQRESAELATRARAAAAQSEQFAAAVYEGYWRAEQAAQVLEMLCGRFQGAVGEAAVGVERASVWGTLPCAVPLSRRVGRAGAGENGGHGGGKRGKDGSAGQDVLPSGEGLEWGKLCSMCKLVMGPHAFSKKQWATRASFRKCFACTSRYQCGR
jgi:hypothetical protein